MSTVEWLVKQSAFLMEPQVKHQQLGWLPLNKEINFKMCDIEIDMKILFDWLNRFSLSFHHFQDAEGVGVGWQAPDIQGNSFQAENLLTDWTANHQRVL